MSVDPNPAQESAGSPATKKQPTPASGTPTGGTPTGAAEKTPKSNEESNEGSSNESSEETSRKRGRPRKQSTARNTRSVELVLTVTGTADGEWQADLKHGSERVVQGLRIPATAVSRAAKELHDEISNGIETVLGAAREQHRSRLEELEAEMRKVKEALAELEE